MKSSRKTVVFYIVFILLIVTIASLYANSSTQTSLSYSDVKKLFTEEKVTEFVIDTDNTLAMKLKDNTIVSYKLAYVSVFLDDMQDLINEQFSSGIIKAYDIVAETDLPWWISILPYVLVIIVLVVIWWLFISKAADMSKNGGSAGGGFGARMNSFSRARTKLGADEKNKVLFTDVAGADEEKEELKEIVDFLKNPDRFSKLGAKIPRGVLLVGAPGTGKTLLAKAVAGEAGVPFFSISGSDFVEMYVGVGASRVRDLFDTAKHSAPSIIFIDEIDAVGRHRGAGWGGGHDEREQTLNQLLVEMDGFGVNDGVIVIAATNRPDILDPALLRPGRFDRQVTVNYPDIKGRVEILKVHSRKKPLEDKVDLEAIAKSTSGFTGADLANLMNEAALHAARKGKSLIGMEDIEEAQIKVMVGPQKRSRVMKESEKRATAYHEGGHAIVSHVLLPDEYVHQVSIIPSGRALGYTLSVPKEDKYSVYKHEMINNIAMLLGGRVAEKLVLHDISAGASNDIQRATEIARKMVTQYGMSDELGPIVFGTGHDEVFLGKDFSSTRNYSEEVASRIDAEIHSFVTEGYKLAEKILTENMDKLNFLADFLVKYEVMDGDQFAAVFEEGATEETLVAIKEDKRKKSAAENEEKRKSDEMKESEETEKTDSDKIHEDKI